MLEYFKTLMAIKADRLLSGIRSVPAAFRIILKLQFLLVAVAFTMASAVSTIGVHQGYERIAFALPAMEKGILPWQTEVDAFGHKVSRAFGVRSTTAREFAGWILEASERQGLEPELLASLVVTESSFRKDARSHIGAIGPTQIRPEFWSSFCGSSNLDDPEENIYCGAQVLAHLLERCGEDTTCALQAYNIGMHSNEVQAGLRYVSKIDRYRDDLRKLPL